MKKVVIAALALLIPTAALAQDPPADPNAAPAAPPPAATGMAASQMIGADLQLALPVGDFSDAAGFGIGALIRYERMVIPKLSLTGRVGYIYNLGKDVGPINIQFSTIPILVGIKYDITPELYAGAEAGLFHNMATGEFMGVSMSNSETDFGVTLGGGYRLGAIDLRLSLFILDMSEAGDSMELVGGIGYNFWNG